MIPVHSCAALCHSSDGMQRGYIFVTIRLLGYIAVRNENDDIHKLPHLLWQRLILITSQAKHKRERTLLLLLRKGVKYSYSAFNKVEMDIEPTRLLLVSVTLPNGDLSCVPP